MNKLKLTKILFLVSLILGVTLYLLIIQSANVSLQSLFRNRPNYNIDIQNKNSMLLDKLLNTKEMSKELTLEHIDILQSDKGKYPYSSLYIYAKYMQYDLILDQIVIQYPNNQVSTTMRDSIIASRENDGVYTNEDIPIHLSNIDESIEYVCINRISEDSNKNSYTMCHLSKIENSILNLIYIKYNEIIPEAILNEMVISIIGIF